MAPQYRLKRRQHKLKLQNHRILKETQSPNLHYLYICCLTLWCRVLSKAGEFWGYIVCLLRMGNKKSSKKPNHIMVEWNIMCTLQDVRASFRVGGGVHFLELNIKHGRRDFNGKNHLPSTMFEWEAAICREDTSLTSQLLWQPHLIYTLGDDMLVPKR